MLYEFSIFSGVNITSCGNLHMGQRSIFRMTTDGFVWVGVVDNIRPACLLGREEWRVQEVGDKGNLPRILLWWSAGWQQPLPHLPLGAKQANFLHVILDKIQIKA